MTANSFLNRQLYLYASIALLLPLFQGAVSNAFSVAIVRLSISKSPTKTTPTLLYLSNDDKDNTNDGDFMKGLRDRMNQVTDRDTKVPIVVLDSMLPRQVLLLESNNTVFKKLVRTLIEEENPSFGMVGASRLTTGQTAPLQNGVEVRIVGIPQVLPGTDGAIRLVLRGDRRMRIVGELANSENGWTQARVKFLNAQDEESAEAEDTSETTTSTTTTLAQARVMAKEFTSPNMNMKDNKSLVDRWIELAKEREREPGQIDRVLQDLGPLPGSDQPSEAAFWVGALVNPLPGMGVAMEIRPALLMAQTAEERVKLARNGILASIRHMDGSAPLF
jgi:Lon protease-like protein